LLLSLVLISFFYCYAKGIENLLDFSISFAVDPRSDSSGEESEFELESDDDDDDSFNPTKFRKLGTSSGSGRQVNARGHQSR